MHKLAYPLRRVSSTYTIKLKSNPTTGYFWFIVNYDHNLLKLKKHRYVPPKTNLVGAGGYEMWVFSPTVAALKAPHATPVKLIYARPWELKSAKALKRDQFKVVNIVIRK